MNNTNQKVKLSQKATQIALKSLTGLAATATISTQKRALSFMAPNDPHKQKFMLGGLNHPSQFNFFKVEANRT